MRLLWGAVLLGLGVPAAAHDFWIEVDGNRATFKIGEASKPEPWKLKRERVVALRSIGPQGVSDQQAGIVEGEPGSATLTLSGAGTHLVTLESTPAEIALPAGEFNDYATHEGLTAVLQWRAAHGQSAMPGRELYARRAKAMVQIGPRKTDNVLRPVGLTLEIVAARHPAAGESFPVRVYFRGKPLAGATVRAESLDRPSVNSQAVSDSAGRATFSISASGRWKIATVWSVPIANNTRADFDTQFASLTFTIGNR